MGMNRTLTVDLCKTQPPEGGRCPGVLDAGTELVCGEGPRRASVKRRTQEQEADHMSHC